MLTKEEITNQVSKLISLESEKDLSLVCSQVLEKNVGVVLSCEDKDLIKLDTGGISLESSLSFFNKELSLTEKFNTKLSTVRGAEKLDKKAVHSSNFILGLWNVFSEEELLEIKKSSEMVSLNSKSDTKPWSDFILDRNSYKSLVSHILTHGTIIDPEIEKFNAGLNLNKTFDGSCDLTINGSVVNVNLALNNYLEGTIIKGLINSYYINVRISSVVVGLQINK
jgi:hypothetical protein